MVPSGVAAVTDRGVITTIGSLIRLASATSCLDGSGERTGCV